MSTEFIKKVRNAVDVHKDISDIVFSTDKHRELYLAAGLTEKAYDHAANLIEDWLGDPNRAIPRAAQQVLKGKVTTRLAKALMIEHHITQSILGTGTITLYRGVTGSYARGLIRTLKKKGKVVVPLRGADSWADNKNTAQSFGHVIMKVTFPKKYVIMCHESNHQLRNMDESEYIVAHPKKKITLTHKHFTYDEDWFTNHSWWD